MFKSRLRYDEAWTKHILKFAYIHFVDLFSYSLQGAKVCKQEADMTRYSFISCDQIVGGSVCFAEPSSVLAFALSLFAV